MVLLHSVVIHVVAAVSEEGGVEEVMHITLEVDMVIAKVALVITMIIVAVVLPMKDEVEVDMMTVAEVDTEGMGIGGVNRIPLSRFLTEHLEMIDIMSSW